MKQTMFVSCLVSLLVALPARGADKVVLAGADHGLRADGAKLDKGELRLRAPHVDDLGHGAGEMRRVGRQLGVVLRRLRPEARGNGVARLIMKELESHLVKAGIKTARLETGIHQPESLVLYEKCGYTRTQPFGAYKPDPLSVFFEKHL